MQSIYIFIPETNYVRREYSVAAIHFLLFMVLISLVTVLNLLYFYISTFRSMCAYYYYYYYYHHHNHYHHHICALWQHRMHWHAFFKKVTKVVRTQKRAVLIYCSAEA